MNIRFASALGASSWYWSLSSIDYNYHVAFSSCAQQQLMLCCASAVSQGALC